MNLRTVAAVPCRCMARWARFYGLTYPLWVTRSLSRAGLLILELFSRPIRMYEQMPKEASRDE